MQIGNLLTLLITVIVGIALLTSLSNYVNLADTLGTSTNESITITENTWTTLAHDDLISVSALRNMSSGAAIGSGNYTGTNVDTDDGRIFANNTGEGSGTYGIDYTYYPSAYVKNATSRDLAPLFLVFFILGIIGLAIWFVRKQRLFSGL